MRFALVLAVLLVLLGACKKQPTEPVDEPDEHVAVFTPDLMKARPWLPGAEQPVVDLARGPLAIYPTGAGQNLRQTFLATANQRLGYIELPVACAPGVLLNVKVREGFEGALLYEVNVRGLDGPVDGVFDLIQVFNPATPDGLRLRRGREYAFELAAFPGPQATGNTCGIASGPAANSYAGGRGYYQDPVNGPFFFPLPDGAPRSDQDLPFRTRVR